jgi:hypothetical protein
VLSKNALSVLLLAGAVVSAAGPAPAAAAPAAPAAAGRAGRYDMSSLEALWEQAGGSPSTAVNAACHGMQESSGNPGSSSPNPDGGTNYGLWQLDTRGKGAGYSPGQLEDPLTNARITVAATGDGTNWSSWATPGC